MSGKKVTVEEAKNLIKALYPSISRTRRSVVPDLRSKVVQANLDRTFNKESTKRQFQPLKVDDLLKYESNEPKKKISEARKLMPTPAESVFSNVLYFKTRNQLLHVSDFEKLVSSQTSAFDWSTFPNEKYTLKVRQARSHDTLLPKGGFYLIFSSADEAAAYMVDTVGQQLNGVNFYPEMVNPEVHKDNMHCSMLLETLVTKAENLWDVTSKSDRDQFVVVRGFPTFVKSTTISDMLWDYEIDYKSEEPIKVLKEDKISKIGVWLIKFSNRLDALRFARNYNGKHFNNESRFPKVFVSVLS